MADPNAHDPDKNTEAASQSNGPEHHDSGLSRPVTTAISEDEYNDLVRQGERTIDNLKRVFAVVFALSFGFVGLSIVDKIKPILTDASAIVPDAVTWIVNIEMVTMFIVTAGVFYHQSG